MLEIGVEKASKRFQYEWIFKELSLVLKPKDKLAITGSNGSGKSTLLKCLTGSIPLTSGKINFNFEGKNVDEGDWFRHLSIAAPYLELPEEFTLEELIQFHFRFKQPINGMTPEEIIRLAYLEEHSQKMVSQFSSGMKQRLKLILALISEVGIIFLDEPTSNLDIRGIDWYREMIKKFQGDKILVICSNEPREFDFCEQKLVLENYK